MTRLIIIENPSDDIIKELTKPIRNSLFDGGIVCRLEAKPVIEEEAAAPTKEIPERIKDLVKKARQYVNAQERNATGSGAYKPRDTKKQYWKVHQVARHYGLSIKELLPIFEYLEIETHLDGKTNRLMPSANGPELNYFLTETPISQTL